MEKQVSRAVVIGVSDKGKRFSVHIKHDVEGDFWLNGFKTDNKMPECGNGDIVSFKMDEVPGDAGITWHNLKGVIAVEDKFSDHVVEEKINEVKDVKTVKDYNEQKEDGFCFGMAVNAVLRDGISVGGTEETIKTIERYFGLIKKARKQLLGV